MNEKSRPYISSVARALYFQLKAFGILAAHTPDGGEAAFETIVNPRIFFLKLVLQSPWDMKGKRELASIASGDPMIYSIAGWLEGTSTIGRFDADGPVSFETHLDSWFEMVSVQKQGFQGEVANALVKAALGILKDTGDFNSAIAHILDLQLNGFITRTDAARSAIQDLLKARRLVAGDNDLITLLLGAGAWILPDWIHLRCTPVDFSRRAIRHDLIDDFEALLDYAEERVDAVRNATSYDSWILGQHSLSSLLTSILAALALFEVHQAPAFSARIVRLEEICADAGAMVGMLRQLRILQFPYAANFSGAEILAAQFARKTPDWRIRLLEDRAVVPKQLEHRLTEDGIDGTLPQQWQAVSATLAPIMGPLVFEDDCSNRRRYYFKRDEVQRSPAAQAFLRAIKADKRIDAEHALSSVMSGVRHLLQNDEQANLLCRIAQYSEDELAADLDLLDLKMRVEEIQKLGSEVSSVGKSNDVLKEEILERLNTLYPYCDTGLVVRAVFLNDTSRSRNAVPYLIDAIVLEPDEHLRWLSMGIALDRLGANTDAQAAFLLYDAVNAARTE